MAITFKDHNGDGNSTKDFPFPSIKVADVKVDVDGILYENRDITGASSGATTFRITDYTTNGGGNVVFDTAPTSGSIRIFRDTDVDSAKHTYTAGSSIRADDLNANHEQLLFASQEEQNQTVLTSDIKDGAVTSAKILDGTIVNADINASAAIEGSKIQASSGSVAGTMSSANFTKLAGIETGATADQTNAEIRTAVEAASDSNVFTDADHSKLDGIESGATADQTNAEIRAAVEAATDSNVFTDADHTKLNAIEAGATADQTVTEIKSLIAGSPLDDSHLAPNSVTTSEIASSQLTTLAGMQGGTASILADSTALTSTTTELNQLDGKTLGETSLTTNSDTAIPTSKAVADFVSNTISPIGGLEVISNEVSFPNTLPAAGVVVSISDAGGVVIDGSGVSTTGRTVGGTTVTINGFPSSLQSSTLAANIGLMVSSTGSSQTYTYHKILGKEDDIKQLSDDINDFQSRYRVGSSNPTSSLDGGDLFFNTSTSKLLVYNATNTAWEEAQSIGNFFISTLSPAFNGSLQDFTITNAPANAQQILLSINGVVQKPNSGTSTPSEGFALSGSTVKLSAPPASGADYFAVVIGSTVNIGTPSNNSVSTDILQANAVTPAKLSIMDNVNDAGTAGKLRLNPEDASSAWQRDNKNMHQIRDDVYVEGTLNVGDKAGFDFTPLSISAFSYSGTTLTLTTAAHSIAVGTNILIKDSASGFQEAFNTITGTTGTTIKVTRAADPNATSNQLSTANTTVTVYTPADPRGCVNVAKNLAKIDELGFNPALRTFIGKDLTLPATANNEVFKIQTKKVGTTGFTYTQTGTSITVSKTSHGFAPEWSSSVSYTSGNRVQANGKVYQANNTINSGGSEPSHSSGTDNNWVFVSNHNNTSARVTIIFTADGSDNKPADGAYTITSANSAAFVVTAASSQTISSDTACTVASEDSIATLLHSTRELGTRQRLALTIDDGNSYPDGKSLVLTQNGVKITADDTALTDSDELLEVEGNAKIDGNLEITGTVTAGGDGTITGDELFITDSIKHVGDTDTSISFPSNDSIRLSTAGTPRLDIDNNGKATFSGDVEISADELFIGDSIKHVGDTDTIISFPAANTIRFHTAGTQRLDITDAGNIVINDGNLQVANGHGIDFSDTSDASGGTSELFDDYEEGTWTPAISGVSYGDAQGTYIKTGRACFVTLTLNQANTSAGNADTRITGLPFTPNVDSGEYYPANSIPLFEVSSVSLASGYNNMYLRIDDAQGNLQILVTDGESHAILSSGGGTTLNSNHVLRTSFTYETG